MLLVEALLDRVEHAVDLERLDGADLVALGTSPRATVHDFTGLPSISTTQAPQLEVSQPQWVPVRPERVADEVHEQRARLDVVRDRSRR